MPIRFVNQGFRVNNMLALRQTGSPVGQAHSTGGVAILAQEDGSRVDSDPFVAAVSDTSLTIAIVEKIMPLTSIGYLFQAPVPLNFEAFVNANGTIFWQILASGGGSRGNTTTGVFDDGVERLYIFHMSAGALTLHTAKFLPGELMTLAPSVGPSGIFTGPFTGLSDVFFNASAGGTFPLKLNSTLAQPGPWNNQPAPSVSDCQEVLEGYLNLPFSIEQAKRRGLYYFDSSPRSK